MAGLVAACTAAVLAAITNGTGDLDLVPEPAISESEVLAAVQGCLAAARLVEAEVAGGERLSAARAAVELVRAYDKILDYIRLVPLSAQQQEFLRHQLAPVAELLQRYRLRGGPGTSHRRTHSDLPFDGRK